MTPGASELSRAESPPGGSPLAYAHGAPLPLANVRPLLLLLPNLLAVVVLFLPISYDDPPIKPILQYAERHVLKQNVRSDIWEAFITGPFLLAVPLAAWTIRLSIAPRAGRRESIIAWSITITSLTMTLLAMCYTAALIRQNHG